MKLEKVLPFIKSRLTLNEETGCMDFRGCDNGSGYGIVDISEGGKRICRVMVHRAIYEEAHGPIAEEVKIRHSCDRTRCCNIDHLLAGSNADNVQDRVERNRSARGSRHGLSKLIEDDVRAIRIAAAHGATREELAKEYKVNPRNIDFIVERVTWSHVQ